MKAQAKPGYLLVIPWDLRATGGVAEVVRNLHRDLGSAGWTPSVMVSEWAARIPYEDCSSSVPVLRWRIRPPWDSRHPVKSVLGYLATLPRVAWTWRQLSRRHNWQVVNFHYPGFSCLTLILLKRLRIWRGRVLLSVHGKEVRDAMVDGRWLERRLMQLALEKADAVVACALELAQDVAKFAPGAGDRVWVIHNGVNPRLLRADLARPSPFLRALSKRRLILNVATFEHKKSQDVLIEAFARVADEFEDVDLVLVGRASAWLEQLRQQAQVAGVADRVHFFVDLPHEHIASFLSSASVFCLPSRSEGHPLAILEAAVFAVPVVATPVGGVPQTITDETDGLLVAIGDPVALSDAMCRLLGDRALADRLGRNLQRRVESHFSWAQAAERYTELAKHGRFVQRD